MIVKSLGITLKIVDSIDNQKDKETQARSTRSKLGNGVPKLRIGIGYWRGKGDTKERKTQTAE